MSSSRLHLNYAQNYNESLNNYCTSTFYPNTLEMLITVHAISSCLKSRIRISIHRVQPILHKLPITYSDEKQFQASFY